MIPWTSPVVIVIVVLIVAAVVLFFVQRSISSPLTAAQAEAKLQEMLRGKVDADKSLHNGVLLVDAPALDVEGVWAAGVAKERDSSPMMPDTPFLSASIGKLFTAATVLSLVDEGVVSLDEKLTDWLPPEVYSGIPVEGGDEALHAVSLRHLLSHRSGIPDYYEGKTADGAPTVNELLVDEPDRTWTPQSLLDYVKLHYEPAGAPGASFMYSDTNYDLLGLIVEAATGQPFHEVVANRVLSPSDLDATWYHARTNPSRSGPPQGEVAYADLWMGDVNVAGAPALSLDWAGGGLATTVDDLRTFMRGLLVGKPVALDAFYEGWTENAVARAIDYGLGIWRIRSADLFFLLRGYPDLYGASGSTGTYLYYVPEYDAVVAGAFNQSAYQQKHVRFLLQVLAVIRRVES